MDVIESVNLLVSPYLDGFCSPKYKRKHFQAAANGTILRSEIVGSIKLSVYLSGMPELRLGLNDRFHLENPNPNGKCFLIGVTNDFLTQAG